MSDIVLNLDGVEPVDFFGENNAKLNLIKAKYSELSIVSRGDTIRISGDKKAAQDLKNKIETLIRILKDFKSLSTQNIEDVLQGVNPMQNKIDPNGNSNHVIVFNKDGFPIKARTVNQKKLVEASKKNDILFAIGPAGTGKTYTAVALAVSALKNRAVKKIILTRPAVEAGENLGFLPGDLKEKVDPYLRPLYDALEDMIPTDKLAGFMTTRTIEVAPLAYMRGRTLDNAYIILDEAQNATLSQLKMFLTRLGPNGKIIVTGDLTQIDLPRSHQSGLRHTLNILNGIEGIDQIYLNEDDVVRHRLVREIIKAFQSNGDESSYKPDRRKIFEDLGQLPQQSKDAAASS